jgi:hypothetical protein
VKKFTFTKLELLKLVGICIKSATAIIGGSLILVEGHPYLSVIILSIGAVANEIVSYIKEKENEKPSE